MYIEQYQKKGKRSYRFRLNLGRDMYGNRVVATRSGFKTKREA